MALLGSMYCQAQHWKDCTADSAVDTTTCTTRQLVNMRYSCWQNRSDGTSCKPSSVAAGYGEPLHMQASKHGLRKAGSWGMLLLYR